MLGASTSLLKISSKLGLWLVCSKNSNFSVGSGPRHRHLHDTSDLRGRYFRGPGQGERVGRPPPTPHPCTRRGPRRARQAQLAASTRRRRNTHHQLLGQVHGHRHRRVGHFMHGEFPIKHSPRIFIFGPYLVHKIDWRWLHNTTFKLFEFAKWRVL